MNDLDLAAKVRLLTGATLFTLYGEDRIGLRPMAFSDGPTGVRGLEFTGGPFVSLLPNATVLASTWDTGVAREVGEILAEEARRQHIDVVLGPTINLHRSLLGGRLFEAYSEDPLLTGVLAAAYVDGLQSRGVGACLKHLVGNESETDRQTMNSVIDERTLRELYLLPFEIAVAESDPWSVMAAYNDVNGIPATEHDEINNGILKREWGWTGLLMSDWFATKSTAASANGGLDLVMPGPHGPWAEALVAAVGSGEVAEATIDEHLDRLLGLARKVGALGNEHEPLPELSELPEPDSDTRREQLLRIAAAGMTVLTNAEVLPLAPQSTVALIGRHGIETVCMGGGSAAVRPPHQISVADGLAVRLGDRLTVLDGVGVRLRPRAGAPAYLEDPVTGGPGFRYRLYDEGGALLEEAVQTENTKMIGLDGKEVARAELTTIVPAGALTIGVLGVGDWSVRGGAEFTRQIGPESNDAGAAILRPPGYQTEVEFAEPTELVAEVRPGARGAFGFVAEPTRAGDDEQIAAAARAAAGADVAVVVVGLTEEQETEAADKSTLALPGRQDELVEAVAETARRTVVVVNAATPVLMPWIDQVEAVLVAGIPGQEGGHAIAAALLGEIEPAGRLVTTIPVADAATPAWDVVPVDGRIEYTEGPYVGYRGHAAGRAPEPAFWFGHGLGYGVWSYDSARADGSAVVVELTNTSARDSREVVQVYYDPQRDDQPVRLAGWSLADVPAGKSATVEVRCDERMWRTWNTETHSWDRLSGGELLVARGLGDIRLRLSQ